MTVSKALLLPVLIASLGLMAAGLSRAAAPAQTRYFHPPDSPFITSPDETVETLSINSESLAKVQEALNTARKARPAAVVVLRLAGTLTVHDSPLRIASKTCVLFDDKARLVAGQNVTAEALIAVENAEFVSISSVGPVRAILDGGERVRTGILARDSGKVHLDNLIVTNCAGPGIDYGGRGVDRYSDAGSLTRCRVTGCRSGLVVRETAQFICVDNTFLGSVRVGADLDSFSATVINNHCAGNAVGIHCRGENAALARNLLRDNDVGMKLDAASKLNLLSYNRLAGNKLGLALDGEKNSIYYNEMDNEEELDLGGQANIIVGHRNVRPEEVVGRDEAARQGEGNLYFNPPTFGNNHQDQVIVNGLGRFDLEVQGGKGKSFHHPKPTPEPADLSVAQAAIDKACAEHPNDVVVAHLKGLWIATGEAVGLRIPKNVCVIVYGSIKCQSEDLDYRRNGRNTQLILMADKGFASLSGGVLDGRFQPYHVVNAPGKNIAVIDGVTVKGSGFNGITTKHHGGRGLPLFIRGCTVVDCGNRGIWAHVSQNVFIIDNVCSGNVSDGIDLDAYCMRSAALFNVCTGNRRHGVFVEEGVKDDLVFGNTLSGNLNQGVHTWNEAVKGNTGRNVIACNTCIGNGVGVSVGGRSAEKTSNGNFFFNNVCRDSRRAGMVYGNRHAKGNYFAQQVLRGNAEPVLNWTGRPMSLFFVAPLR